MKTATKKKKKKTGDQYSKFINGIGLPAATRDKWDQGAFIKVPLIWYQMMSRDEVTLLAYLWNLYNIVEQQGELVNGDWFYCTNQRIERYLGMSRKVQCRVFNELERRRFVVRNHRPSGKPGQYDIRYVRLNRTRILKKAHLKMGVVNSKGEML